MLTRKPASRTLRVSMFHVRSQMVRQDATAWIRGGHRFSDSVMKVQRHWEGCPSLDMPHETLPL